MHSCNIRSFFFFLLSMFMISGSETHILNTDMQVKVLQALETAGIFTSGGLVKDKVQISRTLFVLAKSFPAILSKQTRRIGHLF